MVLKIPIEAFFRASMEIPDNITWRILVHIVLPHVGIKDHLCYLKEMHEYIKSCREFPIDTLFIVV